MSMFLDLKRGICIRAIEVWAPNAWGTWPNGVNKRFRFRFKLRHYNLVFMCLCWTNKRLMVSFRVYVAGVLQRERSEELFFPDRCHWGNSCTACIAHSILSRVPVDKNIMQCLYELFVWKMKYENIDLCTLMFCRRCVVGSYNQLRRWLCTLFMSWKNSVASSWLWPDSAGLFLSGWYFLAISM